MSGDCENVFIEPDNSKLFESNEYYNLEQYEGGCSLTTINN